MPAPTFPKASAGSCAAARSKAASCTSRATMANRLPAFETFITQLRTVWAAESEDRARMERAKPLLERLVMDASLKAHSASWPSTEGRKNLRLYVDPDHDFVINAVVRAPGRK